MWLPVIGATVEVDAFGEQCRAEVISVLGRSCSVRLLDGRYLGEELCLEVHQLSPFPGMPPSVPVA